MQRTDCYQTLQGSAKKLVSATGLHTQLGMWTPVPGGKIRIHLGRVKMRGGAGMRACGATGDYGCSEDSMQCARVPCFYTLKLNVC